LKIKINDIKFEVASSFKPHLWDHINSGNWEKHTFEIIDHFVDDSSVVLDIGCWAGPLTFYMAGKGATVFAIDPDPVAYKALMENLTLNPNLRQNINPYNLAISSNENRVKLYARNGYGDSSTSLLNRIRDTVDCITSEGLSLSQFIKRTHLTKIDFIKMDVEGSEFEIIDSAIATIKQFNYPIMLLSLHYSQLNEFVYQKKVRLKNVSRVMMKLEEYFGLVVFKRTLFEKINKIISLAQKYKFVYDQNGDLISDSNLTPSYLLKNKLDLLLSNKKWNKHEITKSKLY